MLEVNEEKCVGCGQCQPSCPEDAILVWGLAEIDRGKCIDCLACIEWCPLDALEVKN